MTEKLIDYNQFITSSEIDWEAYQSKIDFVDRVKKKDKLEPEEFLKIWNDITMFTYYFLKLDGKPLKLHAFQDMVLSDPHRFKIMRSARQIGKSLCLNVKTVYNLCHDHNYHHNECIISKSLNQAGFQMRRVKQLLNSANFSWRESKGEVDNVGTITLDIYDENDTTWESEERPRRVAYSNALIVAPCTTGALGYDFHSVNLDEVEYWEDIDIRSFFNTIIEPTISNTGGSITSFSNPNGSENYITELEVLKKPCGNRKYHTYVFNFMDYPVRTQADFDEITTGLNRQEIESQYLAERTLSDKYYFTTQEVEGSYDKELDKIKNIIATDGETETYWFLDVGAKYDQSVLTGATIERDDEEDKFVKIKVFCIHIYPQGYPLSRVVGSPSEMHSTDGWHYEKSVKEYLESYAIIPGVNPTFGCDTTGNEGMVPLLEAVNIFPIEVKFSGPKKWAMYQRLKYYFEKGLLRRIKSKEFDYQMKRIVISNLNTSSYKRIGHEIESDHDDVPDSIAGLIYLVDNPTLTIPSLRIF